MKAIAIDNAASLFYNSLTEETNHPTKILTKIGKENYKMGLIKAGIGALGGTLADQWKEFFYCESIPKEVLVTKGQKRVGGRSSNTKGSDNIISNGSGIAVADGQCMIIVEQGKVVEACSEPGEFTWDSSTEPSMRTISQSTPFSLKYLRATTGYFVATTLCW